MFLCKYELLVEYLIIDEINYLEQMYWLMYYYCIVIIYDIAMNQYQLGNF